MKKYILTTILSCLAISFAQAQTIKSSYFLEGSAYRHQLNPAFGGERSYFSFPALGNMNIGINSNMGLSTFLYPSSNPKYDLTTFMDPTVSSDEFLGKLKEKNRLSANVNLQILSVGFKVWKGYGTFDLGVKTQMSSSLPKDLFTFIKNGMNNEGTTHYQLNNLGLSARAYAEMAFGYSMNVTEKIRVGGKAKILIGGAYANMTYDKMDINLSDEKWNINAVGSGNMAVTYLNPKTEIENGKNKITGIETGGNIGPKGYGFAIDLGATYEVIDNLEISASVLDLGFIKWNDATRIWTDAEYTFNGFENIATDEDSPTYEENKIETQFDNLGKDLKNVFVIYADDNLTNISNALAATLNIGANYKMPFYDRLSVSFLSSTRIQGKLSTSEGRFYANVAPLDWLEMSVNYGISSYGSSLGWMLNIHPKGFNLFIGTDSQFFKISPEFIPIKSANTNISFGINFPIGRKLN